MMTQNDGNTETHKLDSHIYTISSGTKGNICFGVRLHKTFVYYM